MGAYAWHKFNSGGETHRVGTGYPNPWGLYDMYGNVWEWCEDQFIGEPYPVSTTGVIDDPCLRGNKGGNQYQVVRGGLLFSALFCAAPAAGAGSIRGGGLLIPDYACAET